MKWVCHTHNSVGDALSEKGSGGFWNVGRSKPKLTNGEFYMSIDRENEWKLRLAGNPGIGSWPGMTMIIYSDNPCEQNRMKLRWKPLWSAQRNPKSLVVMCGPGSAWKPRLRPGFGGLRLTEIEARALGPRPSGLGLGSGLSRGLGAQKHPKASQVQCACQLTRLCRLARVKGSW